MLERPEIPDQLITERVQAEYGLNVDSIAFLPVGADVNSASFRVVTGDAAYFLKLRRGNFDETSVTLPEYLHDQGIEAIIAPIPAQYGRLLVELEGFKLILYPYIEGHDAYGERMANLAWYEFGESVKGYQSIALPQTLSERLRRETYSPHWREEVSLFMEQIQTGGFSDPMASQLAAFLNTKRQAVFDLIRHAEELAGELIARPRELVLCHTDIHPANLHIDRRGRLYIVDWDNPLLAPKERDLMFIGGGQGFVGVTAQEEETLFYRGYGRVDIDRTALAYYRFERIIEDLAAYGEQLFLTGEGGEDRVLAVRYVKSNFEPGNTIERAYAALR